MQRQRIPERETVIFDVIEEPIPGVINCHGIRGSRGPRREHGSRAAGGGISLRNHLNLVSKTLIRGSLGVVVEITVGRAAKRWNKSSRQFEANRRDVKKGIVRDAAVQAAICDDVADSLAGSVGVSGGRIPWSILGGDFNREFFIEAECG